MISLLAVLIFSTACFGVLSSMDVSTSENGKYVYSMLLDDTETLPGSEFEIILRLPYAFEKATLLTLSTVDTATGEVSALSPQDKRYLRTKGYMLTNLDLNKFAKFTSNVDSPKLIEILNLDQKKDGSSFIVDPIADKAFGERFVPDNDTLLDGKRYKVLIDTSSTPFHNQVYTKKVMLVDTSVVSKETISLNNYLGKKYNGWAFQLDLFAVNPNNRDEVSKLSSIIKFSPIVSKEESDQIDKCIKSWRQSLP